MTKLKSRELSQDAICQMGYREQWFNIESAKIYNKLNEEQGTKRKFDGGNEPYAKLHEEFARRMKFIGEKYGLLPKEK